MNIPQTSDDVNWNAVKGTYGLVLPRVMPLLMPYLSTETPQERNSRSVLQNCVDYCGGVGYGYGAFG